MYTIVAQVSRVTEVLQEVGRKEHMADNEEFFPARPETRPMIYAYEEDNPKYAGMLRSASPSSSPY